MPIDMHAHYYGGLVASLMRRRERPNVTRDQDGTLVLNAMTASTVLAPGYTDVAARLAYLDRAGIRSQLMTFPGALGVDVMPLAEVGRAISDYNDHLAVICRGSAGRLHGLAGLPLADMDRAAHEMRRVRRELGLLGAILPGNYFLATASAERLAPVLAAADEVGALLMVHPGLMPGEPPPAPYPDHSVYRASVITLQSQIAHTALTLLLGRFVDDYPNVAFQVVNLGGTIPFVLERLEAVQRSRMPDAPIPMERLRRLHYDCASLGPRALALAVDVLGADRIMLGTDYPIFAPDPVRATVLAAAIPDEARRLVLTGTAAALIARFAT